MCRSAILTGTPTPPHPDAHECTHGLEQERARQECWQDTHQPGRETIVPVSVRAHLVDVLLFTRQPQPRARARLYEHTAGHAKPRARLRAYAPSSAHIRRGLRARQCETRALPGRANPAALYGRALQEPSRLRARALQGMKIRPPFPSVLSMRF